MTKQWILDRLKEPSTYRGLALLASAFGIYLDPALVQTIGAGVVAVFGIIETVRKEK